MFAKISSNGISGRHLRRSIKASTPTKKLVLPNFSGNEVTSEVSSGGASSPPPKSVSLKTLNEEDKDASTNSTSSIDPEKKNVYGEVFTPAVLIKEMLDHLPKNVWTSSNLLWLDPCAGTGNFFDHVIPRLMEGLAREFPVPAARKQHIFKHMLTMVEFNQANVKILKHKYPASANIIHGDFLDDSIMDKPDTFYDVILANPPYQSPKHETYKGSAGNRTLWDQFIKKSMTIRKPGYVLGLITPPNWRRPDHPLFSMLYDKIKYIHIYNKTDGKRLFGVQTRFDLYIISGEGYPQKPIPLLVDELGDKHRGEIVPQDWPFYPNFAYDQIRPLLITDNKGIDVIHDSSLYDARKLTLRPTKRHKYPVIHTLTAQGIGIRYTDQPSKDHFGVPKVILNFNEKQYPVNDYQGTYGMSQLSFGIPIRTKAEGDRMVECMNTPQFQDMIRATKWSSFQTDYRMFTYFRRDFVHILCPHLTSRRTTSRKYRNKHNSSKRLR